MHFRMAGSGDRNRPESRGSTRPILVEIYGIDYFVEAFTLHYGPVMISGASGLPLLEKRKVLFPEHDKDALRGINIPERPSCEM